MSRQSKWTPEQDEILREFGNYGVDKCIEIIKERFGVVRKPDAVRRHAYRIGASVIEYRICANCDGKARKLDENGLCPTCHQRLLAKQQRQFNKELRIEIRQLESGDGFKEAKCSYEKARQESSRLCRKYGLPGKRERMYGDSAKCHAKLSNACSVA